MMGAKPAWPTPTIATREVTRFLYRAAARSRDLGASTEVVGSFPVRFSDYGIAAPSIARFVWVEDHGTVEFQLVFAAPA